MEISKYIMMESSHVDFKETLETKKARSWLKTISAFANTNEGYLLFGVRDTDRKLVGVKDCQGVSEKISEFINARIQPTPVYIVDCITEKEKSFVLVIIKKGTHTPYYYAHEGTKVAYIRKGNESVEVSPHELNTLILRGNNQTFDEIPAFASSFRLSFTLLGATYVQRNPGEIFNEENDLISFGLKTTDGQVTNAGALLCDQGIIRQSRIICTRWKGKEKGSLDLDAIDDKEYTGSLISLLENAVQFVQNNSRKKWVIKGLERIEEEDYPTPALREAIVNALIHRDYQIKGAEVHVDMYDDRLTVSSPGGMYNGWKIQDLDLAHIQSVRRNPVIADVFGRLHFMDRRGSGIQRILGAYRKIERKPEFYSGVDSFVVTLPNVSYERSIWMYEIGQKYSKKTQQQVQLLLKEMVVGQTYTTAELTKRISLSPTRMRQLLNILIEEGNVGKTGSKRDRHYYRMK